MTYSDLSLWFSQLPPVTPRATLTGSVEADVCVVGGGLTGLWTAYYLLKRDPSLRVVVLEKEICGFGASGRNGGWCSALFPVATAGLVRRYGPARALDLRRAMNETVAEVGAVAAAEGIDCDFRTGGTVTLARTPVQLARVEEEVAADEAFGGVDGYELLSAAEASGRVGAADVLGAAYTPYCARIQPAKLVRGLASVVEALGARIYEKTAALEIRPGSTVVTQSGSIRARHTIRATEAWTSTLAGSERDVVPVYSLMVATEPLPETFWKTAGLAAGETFTDARHLIVYGQRTADDRLAFGGRGAPYHFRSAIDPAFDRDESVFTALRATLRGLFPALGDLGDSAFTHAWGGPLGIPRDWHASVGLDRDSGIGWAGGYVGDGVGTTNLAGRTLADLVQGRDTELTRLPWVNHRSPRWEPEPLRWLGVNAGLGAMTAADTEERLTGRPSLAARLLAPLLGH